MVREGRSITAREIQHQDRLELGRAPLARHAPNADWLAPTQGAVRSNNEERREPINRPRRDFDAPRPNGQERGAPRSEPMPRNPDRPAFRQPEPGNARDGEVRREGWRASPETRPGIENRGRPVDVAPIPVPPQRREAAPQEIRQPVPEAGQAQPFDGRRGGFRRPGEGLPDVQGARTSPPDAGVTQGRDTFRRPPESRPEAEMRGRPPESAPAPIRRDMPTPEMRPEGSQPRPLMVPQEREPRREMREAPREAPPVMRQPEMPRPAPEVRMPAPPPVREMPQQRIEPPRQPVQEFRAPPPPPAPAPMPQQRVEPPRQPAPQGGGQPEQRRRHGDDDEHRGR